MQHTQLVTDLRAAARAAARRYGLPESVFLRQINQESGFNPRARSPAGARGIAQIMPATARGWHVNPDDPVASLDAAARNMAQYVQRYGGIENALRAYNAGPGAIEKSRGYRETNNYVRSILGNANQTAPSVGTDATTPTPVGIDTRREQGQAIARFVTGNRDDPLDFALNLRALRVQGQQAPSPSLASSTAAKGGGVGGQLKELFWQGAGGINVKNGQQVPQGFVSGHQDHVHVAAGPRSVVELGRIARDKFKLRVGENPHYGGVNPVHTKTSYHYRGQAIDVSGDPTRMAEFAQYVAQRYGVG